MNDSRYVIGIDLGTTNSALSWVDTASPEEERVVRVLEVPQVIEAGEASALPVLPSSVYIPGKHEIPQGSIDLPWQSNPSFTVGAFARNRGSQLPHRLISSAKSWLCHSGVDRRSGILPTQAEEGDRRMSPVEASTAVLNHLKMAWNHRFAGENPEMAFEKQQVTITVPASFDAVARDLTVEAAKEAGVEEPSLLEEPQAAIYAWVGSRDNDWRRQVSAGDLILVCDIGGGTSDFSLIAVEDRDGELGLTRVAVGDHIMLGGDNFDLALAHTAAAGMGIQLDPWRLQACTHACSRAKEKILSGDGIDTVPIVVPGRGSSLVGGTVRGELTREQVESLVLDGFFPRVDFSERPAERTGAGLQEMGLPYESDPAITRHLAAFISTHASDTERLPTAVLFNGGVFKSVILRRRVLEVLSSWFEKQGATAPRELQGIDLDLAVSRGAALYGTVKRGRGIRIRGGTARSYYVGVEVPMPAVPGVEPPVKAVCVAPFGMEEGSRADLPGKVFALTVGRPARFRFFSSTTRRGDDTGVEIEDWRGSGLEEIAPIECSLDASVSDRGVSIPVSLQSVVTETGTLQLWAVSTIGGERYRLEFRIRDDT